MRLLSWRRCAKRKRHWESKVTRIPSKNNGKIYVGREAVTGARRKAESTYGRGALVASIGGRPGHFQRRSSNGRSAACVEVAGPLRCDPDGGQHARPRRQGREARASSH